ncbi:hypothetical protein [Bounagaea algeriensis]
MSSEASASGASIPRSVRVAGAITTLQALFGWGFVIALLIRGTSDELGAVGTLHRQQTYGEAGYYAFLAACVLAAGIGLLKGKHWARTPALLLQLLLLGTAWYAMGPSERPSVAFALAVPAVAVLYFLFNRDGRSWSWNAGMAPDADRSESG